jgi:hypothetical protein
VAYTLISDIIEPAVYTKYMIEKTATKSALYQSGIIARDPQFDILASTGGSMLDMPFWQDLTGDSQILDTTTNLTVNRIETERDKARLIGRAQVWGAADLTATFAGDDPLDAITSLTGGYWARDMQTTLINILAGVFGAASMSGLVHDISLEAGTGAVLSAENFIDACQLLGDARGGLTGFMAHSAAVSHLEKLDLIDTALDSEGQTIKMYRGKRVIEDDSCPLADGVYTSWLFGPGAIAWGEGKPKVPVEVAREPLSAGGEEYLVNRRHLLLHPRGVAWQEAVCAGDTPTNAELATATNWVRAYEAKNIRIVQFKYRIAAAAGS